MDIEVNEYVRTNKGVIGKLISETLSYPEPSEWILKANNNKIVIVECNDYPVKHSKQLIDLIEAGDIVNKELVIDIIDIANNKEEIIGKKLITQYRSAQFTGLDIKHYIYANDIKTILTKEIYMANCYKVGGKDE